MDLVTRKVTMDGGAPLRSYLNRIAADLGDGPAALEDTLLPAVRDALAVLKRSSALVRADVSADATGAAAANYLRLFAITSLGWMWVRIARAALNQADAIRQRHLALANFYANHVLPQASALEVAIAAGPEPILALDPKML